MYLLFSPSEAKSALSPFSSPYSLSFPQLNPVRKEVLLRYEALLSQGSPEVLAKLFGLKEFEEIALLRSQNPFSSPTQKALFRYTGVGYTHLNPSALPPEAITFLEKHLIIFSNLFGPLLGGDTLPLYKVKQGETLQGLATQTLYKTHATPLLDKLLGGHLVVDLRAGFYEKFYIPSVPYIRPLFYKKGKVVSHWAKAWRGLLARELALWQPQTEDAFNAMAIEGLKIEEIQCKGMQKNYLFSIMD